MSTIRLYTGSTFSETTVGQLVDGTLEVGQASATTYPAHVDRDGTVIFGSTVTSGPAQIVLGHANEQDGTVSEGLTRYADTIGTWDEEGIVYRGASFRRERIGRCDPASGGGAACLLLILADGAPHQDALIAAAQPDSDFCGLEVKCPEEKEAADPADKAAKAVGIAAGAATLGIEMGIKRLWRNRKTAQAKRTAASAGSSAPPPQIDSKPKRSPEPPAPIEPEPPAPFEDGRPRQRVWAPRDRTVTEILAEERAHPGTYLQNEEPVPGAVTQQATAEADIVQPNPAFSAEPRVFVGDDPRADAEAQSIFDHMRTLVSADAIDDEDGIAWAYERGYVTLQDIRGAYKRYLNMKDLVHRFMTRPGE